MKVVFLAMMAFFLNSVAQAGLGQPDSSVETDRGQFTAARHIVNTNPNYTVHELDSDHLTVREYAANGVIFAITWTGMRHPDLSRLLGSYFSDLEQASKSSHKIKGHRSSHRIEGEKVVVEKSGHMRFVQGRAYARELFPAGVSINEIQ